MRKLLLAISIFLLSTVQCLAFGPSLMFYGQGFFNQIVSGNWLTYPIITSGNWSGTNLVVTANNAEAPDGSNRASKLADNATSSPHYTISNNMTFSNGTNYTVSGYFLQSSATVIQVFGPAAQYANFNLSNGTVTASNDCTANLVASVYGYYRCYITMNDLLSGQAIGVALVNNNPTAARAASYSGSGQYLYNWGMRVVVGTAP